MNSTQIQNTLAPIVSFIAGLLTAKFAFFDAATWSAILTGVVGIAATIWGALSSRNSAIASSLVSAVPGTQVVTDAKVANATTSSNVVSNTNAKVVAK